MTNPIHDSALTRLYSKLNSLEAFLDDEFLRGHIFREADVVSSIVQFLRSQLTNDYEFWCIGTQHHLGGVTPDIVCYYSETPNLPPNFVEKRPSYAIGAIEVKFGRLGEDLQKLQKLQSILLSDIGKPILVWNVFGDHYNPEIHRKYYQNHINFEKEMQVWKEGDTRLRGFTTMKCGMNSGFETEAAKQRRELLNEIVWVLDSGSKYRHRD